MKKINKKLLIVLAILFVGLALVAGSVTYAYLTSNDSIENKFTVGKNDIKINEEFDPPESIEPGDKIRKKVSATNIGNTPAYVRAKVLFSDGDMKKNCEDLDIGNNWVYNSNDNYYYYTEKVEPGDDTTPLITDIKIKDTADEEDLKTFDVTVYMESITNEDANSYSEAWR